MHVKLPNMQSVNKLCACWVILHTLFSLKNYQKYYQCQTVCKNHLKKTKDATRGGGVKHAVLTTELSHKYKLKKFGEVN